MYESDFNDEVLAEEGAAVADGFGSGDEDEKEGILGAEPKKKKGVEEGFEDPDDLGEIEEEPLSMDSDEEEDI